jgi:hypothetical protein
MNTIWTEKELEVLRSDRSVEAKAVLLPGRSLRAITERGFRDGYFTRKQGTAGRSAWTAEETTILKSDASLDAKVWLLQGRSPLAVRIRLAELRKSGGYVKPPRTPGTPRADRGRPKTPWSAADIEIISRDIAAKDAAPLLEHFRSVWVIGEKRRNLDLPRPAIGRRSLRPEDYPGTNWDQKVAVLSRTLGVCWVSARQLKRLALGK